MKKLISLVISLQIFTVPAFAFDAFVCQNDETAISMNEVFPDVLEIVSKDGDGRKLRVDIGLTIRKINGNRETQTYLFERDGETYALSVTGQRDLWVDEKGEGTLLLIDLENRRITEEAQFTCRTTVD